MEQRFRISLRRLFAAMTMAAIGGSIFAVPRPPHLSGAALDAADFIQFGVGYLTPFAVLSILFGRPLVFLGLAVGIFFAMGLIISPA